MLHRSLALAAAAALALATPALAGPAEDFKALTDEYWAFVLRENPVFASTLGHREYDAQLGDISLAAEDRRAAEAALDRSGRRIAGRMARLPVDHLGGHRRPRNPDSRDNPHAPTLSYRPVRRSE